jgi:lipopolysaccharide transport system ATP-binding protein
LHGQGITGFKKQKKVLQMCSDSVAISVSNLSKCYHVYGKPIDRLKQFFMPRLNGILGFARRKYYREFWALRDVSFEIKKGETVGIIGRNGSGKSTLLHMICGTLNPTQGDVHVVGRVAALLELGAGFNPEFTGRENIYLYATVLGLSRKDIESRFSEIALFADIGEYIEQPVKTYSSGMMVRLAFAVIAHVDANILIIDEALAVGDAFFTQKCMAFLRNFMKVGTVLFVSHDTGSIKSLCNSTIWLDKGELIKKGSPKEICELYLESVYESGQGKSNTSLSQIPRDKNKTYSVKDQRLDYLNASNLRNDLQVFEFDPYSTSFGKGGALIADVQLLDADESLLLWVVGGEKVLLRIYIHSNQEISYPIVGFFVKDKMGQVLFGENTYLFYKDQLITFAEGEKSRVDFTFYMPLLPVGEYSITVAVADGTQEKHVQHHWVHDALIFKSESSSVSTGLIGVPMLNVSINANVIRNENV